MINRLLAKKIIIAKNIIKLIFLILNIKNK